ncbi:hypothetical protein DESC_810008 [Desulfosarcina cetonica]|nr:hypothetical protein DESC_810008 [Desulfosarcina cetonica]
MGPWRVLDDRIARLPIRGRTDSVLIANLQCRHQANDFLNIATSRKWIVNGRPNNCIRIDHEKTSGGRRGQITGHDHAVKVGDVAIHIRNNRKGYRNAEFFLNISDPSDMREDAVDAQSKQRRPHFLERIGIFGKGNEFARADRREIHRMGKKDQPPAFKIL